MEGTVSCPAEMNRNIYLSKKRKSQSEHVQRPLSKHVHWGQRLEYDSSSNSSMPQEKMDLVMGHESEGESIKDSNSFHADTDSAMLTHSEDKTDQSYGNPFASDEPSTLSSCWSGESSRISPYSLESRSLENSNSINSKLLSQSYENHGYGSNPCLNYEEHLQEFGNDADCYYSEHRNEDAEHSANEELGNQLYSKGIAPNNYVLSSGRWSVNQESQEDTRKLTIDKEFEQYFSTLML